MKPITSFIATCAVALAAAGCVEHRIKAEPIEVKPIHITVDVNLRVQRELEDIFSFEDKYDKSNPPSEPK